MTIAKSRAAKILAYVLMFKSNRYLILVNILHITLGNKTSIIIQHFCRDIFFISWLSPYNKPHFFRTPPQPNPPCFLVQLAWVPQGTMGYQQIAQSKDVGAKCWRHLCLMRLRKRLGKTESSPTSKSKSSFLCLKDLKRPKNSIEVITDWNLWTDRCPPQLLDCEITSSVVAFVLFLWFFC